MQSQMLISDPIDAYVGLFLCAGGPCKEGWDKELPERMFDTDRFP